MWADAFDEKVDSGGDVSDQIDWSKGSGRAKTATELKRVNVDFRCGLREGLTRRRSC